MQSQMSYNLQNTLYTHYTPKRMMPAVTALPSRSHTQHPDKSSVLDFPSRPSVPLQRLLPQQVPCLSLALPTLTFISWPLLSVQDSSRPPSTQLSCLRAPVTGSEPATRTRIPQATSASGDVHALMPAHT